MRVRPALIRRAVSAGWLLMIQPVAQLLAGLEERDVLLADVDAVAGARVAADSGVAAFDRERAEAAQLYPVAARQRRRDLVEDRGDDDLDVALVEMRVGLRKSLDELRFRHRGRSSREMRSAVTVPKPRISVKRSAPPPLRPTPWSSSSPRFRFRFRSRPRPGADGSPRPGCRRGWRPSRTSRTPPSPSSPRRPRAP